MQECVSCSQTRSSMHLRFKQRDSENDEDGEPRGIGRTERVVTLYVGANVVLRLSRKHSMDVEEVLVIPTAFGIERVEFIKTTTTSLAKRNTFEQHYIRWQSPNVYIRWMVQYVCL